MERQMNWIEVAPDTFVTQKKYSTPPKLETIFEEDNIEFLHFTNKLVYFLPLFLFLGSFLVLFKNFDGLSL
ncbi:unnamed protein product [Amaranthus hypochondriacus]